MRLTKGWDTKELRCVSSEYTYDGMDASVPFIFNIAFDRQHRNAIKKHTLFRGVDASIDSPFF